MRFGVCVLVTMVWALCVSPAKADFSPGSHGVHGRDVGAVDKERGEAFARTDVVSVPAPVVVFQPGILGYAHLDGMGDYWGDVPKRLRELGFVVVERAPAPVGSPAARGVALAHDVIAIAAAHGVDRVVVIAHSQGGVDVRYALALVPELRAHLGAVATIATPHHGSSMTDVADVFPDAFVDAVLTDIHVAFEADQRLAPHTAMVRETLTALSSSAMADFNAAHPDPGVPFFSVGGVTGADVDNACAGGVWGSPEVTDVAAPTTLLSLWAQRWVVGADSNDGVVSTASMHFATFLGCAPADHGDWMGWPSHPLEEELVWSPTPFLVELATALVDVERSGPKAMAPHVPTLARYARAPLQIHGHNAVSATVGEKRPADASGLAL